MQWTTPTQGEVVAPAVADSTGRVFVGSDDKFLYAVNSVDGSLLYKVTTVCACVLSAC